MQRQADDLLRERSEDWPWVFDAEMAARPCAFAELLPHIKGKWAREGRLLELEPWQCFILTTVFGWVHHETRLRRFLEAYEEEARKNGKSAKGSALLLYMLAADGEHGAECYTAATTRDQARIVFDDAKDMAERSPGLRTHLGVAIMQHSLTVAHTSSKAAPLAAEGSTLDGLNVHFALLDELHAHKTRAVYDVIDSARGAREQSLLWTITTAGTDRSGICYERRTHDIKDRLLALHDARLTQGGVVVIKAQTHRSQELNRADALVRLDALIRSVALPPRVRRATRPTLASQIRRREGKRQRSAVKALRGRVAD